MSASRRDATRWSPDLVVAVALSYLMVTIVFFGVGYLIGRLVL